MGPKTSKSADRPHYVAICLSLLAVLVSCLSWWESHTSRKINETASRGIAYVTNFQKRGKDVNDAAYLITIKNFGRSSALAVRYSYSITTDNPHKTGTPDERHEEQPDPYFFSVTAELPPGLEKQIATSIMWSSAMNFIPKLEEGKYYYIIGILSYVDEASGKEYRQQWCYQADSTS